MRKLLVLFVFLYSCSSTGIRSQDYLHVITFFDQEKYTEGDVARITLKITNKSKDHVMLLGLFINNPYYSVLWQSARNGKVHFDNKKDEFIHFKKADDRTLSIFNTGFIPPGNFKEVTLRMKIMNQAVNTNIDFLVMSQGDIKKNIYFLSEESDAVSIYKKAQVLDKIQFTGKVIYPVTPSLYAVQRAEFPTSVILQNREKGFESFAPEEYTFCKVLESWALKKSGKYYLYKDKNLTELCNFDLQAFLHIDLESPSAITFQFENFTNIMFEEKYKIQKVIGPTKNNFFVVVLDKKDLVKFFNDVKTEGFRIGLNSDMRLAVFR